MPSPAPIDLNATPIAGGSSYGGARRRTREMPTDMIPSARNLFHRMPSADDDDFMQNIIFEAGTEAAGGAAAVGYNPDETQSQDGRELFTPSIFDKSGMQDAFMRDQIGLDLDGFPLDHKFLEDYDLEEEDELDIDGEPLFEDELANQAAGVKLKHKSRRTKAYTTAEDKLLCECWRDIGQEPKTGAEQKASTFWAHVHREFHERKKFQLYQMHSTRGWVSISKRCKVIQQECNKFCSTLPSIKARPVSNIGMQDMAFKVQHEGKSFHLSHCWRVIKDEEKFRAQFAALMARGGKKAEEEVGEGEKARPRGKTNTNKEDKRDAASIALIASVEDMMTKKDSREEKRRKDKEEQMNAFTEIQRRTFEMVEEKQTRMPEMEAEKQVKMLKIEAANAKTKAKEVALASMKTGVEIMKVDLNTVSPKKRSWFEKMQARHAQVRQRVIYGGEDHPFCMPASVLA
ncbi:hypothetical protein VPH35_091787 [Triticum aestivum]